MTLLYYLLLCIAHIVLLPIMCVMAYKKKYKDSIPLRFFSPTNRSKEHYDIWLHACSVGEVQSLQTIIESISKTQSLLLTVITQTGYVCAKKLYSKYDNLTIGYLPFETLLPFCAPKCKKLFVFEAELWLMLFVCAKRSGAETKLINARISTRSFGRYKKLRVFYRHFFYFVDSVLSQSDEDTKRLCMLGAKNVKTLGNIKLTNPITPNFFYKKPKSLVVVAASTHADEELLILESWQQAKGVWGMDDKANNVDFDIHEIKQDNTKAKTENAEFQDFSISCNFSAFSNPAQYDLTKYIHNPYNIQCDTYNNNFSLCANINSCQPIKSLLVVAPRHPERFDVVYEICRKYGKTLRLKTLQHDGMLDIDKIDADILLIDTIGMLVDFYAISDIVILGGAFAKIGGHNPLEPANFHNILISGKEIFNQKALFAYVYNYYLADNKDSLTELLCGYRHLFVSSINKSLHNDMIEQILK